jgi:hypothetical protein
MSIIRSVRLQVTARAMESCCSGALAVRRAAAWYYVLGVKEDAAVLTANQTLPQHTVPHSVICSLTLLMMDKVLSETC